jgi:hypothetical protein
MPAPLFSFTVSMKQLLLLPLLLLGAWPAISQTTGPVAIPSTVSPSSAEVCLPADQAQVIRAALIRFEWLKRAYVQKSGAYQSLLAGHEQDSLLLASNGRLIGWYRAAYIQEQALRQDATARLAVSQGKAARRGLLVGVEGVLLALLAYVVVTK